MKRKSLLITLMVLFVVIVASYFVFKPRQTKIALFNYPSFMVSRMVSSADTKNVQVKVEDDLKHLTRYDAVLFWGMGGSASEWSQEDRELIQSLDRKEIKFAVLAATNPQNNLANISEEQREVMSNYLFNGGVRNYRSLFNYISADVVGKKNFVQGQRSRNLSFFQTMSFTGKPTKTSLTRMKHIKPIMKVMATGKEPLK